MTGVQTCALPIYLKAAADENGRSVAETLEILKRTADEDRGDHAEEYGPVPTA